MIGVVCGLKSEAEALRPMGASVRVSGASAQRAEAMARELAAEGSTLLLSIGLAGGLHPALLPGQLLLPSAVQFPDGQACNADPNLLDRLSKLLGIRPGHLAAGADAAVMDPAAKAKLAERGSAIVDMETHGVAKAAVEAGLPWAAVRAVADDWRTSLPRWAMGLVQPDGSIHDQRAAVALLKAPWDLPLALRLANANAKALATLSHAAAALARL